MRYTDSNGNEIKNINDWHSFIFASSTKKSHWKYGASAQSLADFMMNENGETFIKKVVSELLKESILLEDAIPEFEMRFDDYRHGREHDLAIWGTTDSKKKVFIGVEAKVDERFNKTIGEAYISAKIEELNGRKTNRPKRIEELLRRHFKKIKPEYSNCDINFFMRPLAH